MIIDHYTSNLCKLVPGLKQLYLKMIWSLNPKYREAIDTLNVYDVPTGDNTPIKRLNEICFLHLRRFLSADDWILLREILWCLQEQKCVRRIRGDFMIINKNETSNQLLLKPIIHLKLLGIFFVISLIIHTTCQLYVPSSWVNSTSKSDR